MEIYSSFSGDKHEAEDVFRQILNFMQNVVYIKGFVSPFEPSSPSFYEHTQVYTDSCISI